MRTNKTEVTRQSVTAFHPAAGGQNLLDRSDWQRRIRTYQSFYSIQLITAARLSKCLLNSTIWIVISVYFYVTDYRMVYDVNV